MTETATESVDQSLIDKIKIVKSNDMLNIFGKKDVIVSLPNSFSKTDMNSVLEKLIEYKNKIDSNLTEYDKKLKQSTLNGWTWMTILVAYAMIVISICQVGLKDLDNILFTSNPTKLNSMKNLLNYIIKLCGILIIFTPLACFQKWFPLVIIFHLLFILVINVLLFLVLDNNKVVNNLKSSSIVLIWVSIVFGIIFFPLALCLSNIANFISGSISTAYATIYNIIIEVIRVLAICAILVGVGMLLFYQYYYQPLQKRSIFDGNLYRLPYKAEFKGEIKRLDKSTSGEYSGDNYGEFNNGEYNDVKFVRDNIEDKFVFYQNNILRVVVLKVFDDDESFSADVMVKKEDEICYKKLVSELKFKWNNDDTYKNRAYVSSEFEIKQNILFSNPTAIITLSLIDPLLSVVDNP